MPVDGKARMQIATAQAPIVIVQLTPCQQTKSPVRFGFLIFLGLAD